MVSQHDPSQDPAPPLNLPRKLAPALLLLFDAVFSGEWFEHAGKPTALEQNALLRLSSTLRGLKGI